MIASGRTSIGTGPELQVFDTLLSMILEDSRHWQMIGEYYTLSLHFSAESTTERLNTIKAYGKLVAIYMIVTGRRPGQVSPALLLDMLHGKDEDPFTPAFINEFYPTGLDMNRLGPLIDWLETRSADDRPPTLGALSTLIISELDTMVCVNENTTCCS